MLVHSPLVDCENTWRGVVRLISGAIVGGPSSKVGRIAVHDIGCIGDVARIGIPFAGIYATRDRAPALSYAAHRPRA
jgi:hypothetical protein